MVSKTYTITNTHTLLVSRYVKLHYNYSTVFNLLMFAFYLTLQSCFFLEFEFFFFKLCYSKGSTNDMFSFLKKKRKEKLFYTWNSPSHGTFIHMLRGLWIYFTYFVN